MKATRVFTIELAFALEPDISPEVAEPLCQNVLNGVREYLENAGFAVEGGSIASRVRIVLQAEPGDDLSFLVHPESDTVH